MNATLACPPASTPPPVRPRASRVLVVDDSIVNQRLTLALLKQRQYDAHAAGNGREAVRILCEEETPYDVVLMDCHMPEMDGAAATVAIREHDGPNQNVVIIALTGTLEETQILGCNNSGMDDYLGKPIQIEEFESVWNRCREGRNSENQPAAVEAKPADNRTPFWDENRLAKLRATMGDEADEFLSEMLGIFLADVPRSIESLHQAVEAADADALREAAHRFKGASRNLGLVRISEVSATLENLGKHGDLTGAMDWFERLKGIANQVADKARMDLGITPVS